jgi:hypothetical protein
MNSAALPHIRKARKALQRKQQAGTNGRPSLWLALLTLFQKHKRKDHNGH